MKVVGLNLRNFSQFLELLQLKFVFVVTKTSNIEVVRTKIHCISGTSRSASLKM